jgi:hypothetical protein
MASMNSSTQYATRVLTSLEIGILECQLDKIGMYMSTYGSEGVFKDRMLGRSYWDLKQLLRSITQKPDFPDWSKLTASFISDYRKYANHTLQYMHGSKEDGTPGRRQDIPHNLTKDAEIEEFVVSAKVLLWQITRESCGRAD